MFGAEQVLIDRARPSAVFDETSSSWSTTSSAYFREHDQPIDENPSPGNKAGGITTLEEKSLGACRRAGDAPVAQVLGYGEPRRSGWAASRCSNAPGNDGVSSTAMAAAGAHIDPVHHRPRHAARVPGRRRSRSPPTRDLAAKKPGWIDFDAGPIALGTSTIEELGPKLFELVLDVASGRTQTKNESNGYREIAIWKDGVTL